MKARNTLGWGSLARSYVTMKIPLFDNVTNDKKVNAVKRIYASRSCLPVVSFIAASIFRL
ncbi:unnamed protein product [Wuchereria bancrofti]|nr:unnamed protein product [Wuchereria bancrofti]